MNKLNYDTFVYIVSFLDPRSIINLILSSKHTYNLYMLNKTYINGILANKILTYLDLNISHQQIIKHKQRNEIYLQLNQLFELANVYKRNRFSNFLMLLSYISKNCTFLFEKILNLCVFKFWVKQYDMHDKTVISTGDMEFMLIYGNKKITNTILLTNYIPAGVLSYVIRYLITLENHNQQIHPRLIYLFGHKRASMLVSKYNFTSNLLFYKITKFFRYIIYKNTPDSENKMYINDIFISLIQFNKLDIFNEIIIYKRQFMIPFDYQLLINKALEYDNINILKILTYEYKFDLSHELITSVNKVNIKIEAKSVQKMITVGEFRCIKFVLGNFLGNYINTHNYISHICEGLTDLFAKIELDMSTFSKLKRFNHIAFYLTLDNRILINKHLTILQKRLNPDFNQDVFLLEGYPLF